MQKVYIITTRIARSELKVSQEGYDSYEKAVEFIKSRYGDIEEITPFHYRVSCPCGLWLNTDRDYFIHEIVIK